MTMDPEQGGTGLEADRDQALWKLLGRARAVEVSPYFSRRVLRDLAAGVGEASGGWRAWLRPAWILGGGMAVVAVALGMISLSFLPGAQPVPMGNGQRQARSAGPRVAPAVAGAPDAAVPPAATASVAAAPAVVASAPAIVPANGAALVDGPDGVSPQDVDVIADLDNLVAREETDVWTDDTSRF
jgi:hypothetical protein